MRGMGLNSVQQKNDQNINRVQYQLIFFGAETRLANVLIYENEAKQL